MEETTAGGEAPAGGTSKQGLGDVVPLSIVAIANQEAGAVSKMPNHPKSWPRLRNPATRRSAVAATIVSDVTSLALASDDANPPQSRMLTNQRLEPILV